MDITERVLSAISKAELGEDVVSGNYEESKKSLDKGAAKFLKFASTILDMAPMISKFNTFTKLNEHERMDWLEKNREGFLGDIIFLLGYYISGWAYVDENRAKAIGYQHRSTLKPVAKFQPSKKLSHEGKPKDRYDVVIVGSGAGGAAVAYELSKHNLSVAVFEAGSEPTEEEFLNDLPINRGTKYFWESGLTFVNGNPSITIPIGKVLGGTVTLNSGTLYRMPQFGLTNWSKQAGINIDSNALNSAYAEVEKRLNVMRVPDELLGNNAMIVRRGAEKLGLVHHATSRPLGTCYGNGECAFGCPYHGKLDMRLTFLSDAVAKGVEIFTSADVKKVIIRGGKAAGVKVNIGGNDLEISAKAVVVSTGAFHTPRLLSISGVKNKNLGKHLHVHPMAAVAGLMEEKVFAWRGTMQSYAVEDLINDWHTVLLATFPPPALSYTEGLPLHDFKELPYFTTLGVQTSDEGEGEVKRTLIGLGDYNVNDGDLEKIKKGIELSSNILFSAGAKKVLLLLKRPKYVDSMSEVVGSLEGLHSNSFRLAGYHPMSSARMGSDKDVGVLDKDGRVYGTSNLYVADASMMPASTILNPQLAINALSLIIADGINKELGG
ncbi:MAG: GMC family oxidoreductase [Thermoplasmatales archaeon]